MLINDSENFLLNDNLTDKEKIEILQNRIRECHKIQEETEKYWEENAQMTSHFIDKFQRNNEVLTSKNNSLTELLNEKTDEIKAFKMTCAEYEEKILELEKQVEDQIYENEIISQYDNELILNNMYQLFQFQTNNDIALVENTYHLIANSINSKDITFLNLVNSLFKDLISKLKATSGIKIPDDFLKREYEENEIQKLFPHYSNINNDIIEANDNIVAIHNDNELSVIIEKDEVEDKNNEIDSQLNKNENVPDAVETMEKEKRDDEKIEHEFKEYKQMYNSDRFAIMENEFNDVLSKNQQLHQKIEELSNKYWKRNQETITILNECQKLKETLLKFQSNSGMIVSNNANNYNFDCHSEERIDNINIQEVLDGSDSYKWYLENASCAKDIVTEEIILYSDRDNSNKTLNEVTKKKINNIIHPPISNVDLLSDSISSNKRKEYKEDENDHPTIEKLKEDYFNEYSHFKKTEEMQNYSEIEKAFMSSLINDLRNENNQLKEKIDSLDGTLSQLKSQVHSSNLENRHIEEELEKLESKNQNLKTLYKKYKEIGFNLHNEIKMLNNEWENIFQSNNQYIMDFKKRYDDKISYLKSALIDLNQKSSYLRNVLTKLFDSLKSNKNFEDKEISFVTDELQNDLMNIDFKI
ncbi:hypothetical protein U3516DRAFT_830904 [Neocallimastix sp. 'constans']